MISQALCGGDPERTKSTEMGLEHPNGIHPARVRVTGTDRYQNRTGTKTGQTDRGLGAQTLHTINKVGRAN